MAKAEIAAKEPRAMTLQPGTYYWCACGKSANQPFCDGSHKGGEFTPLPFEVEEEKQFYLCQCKQTGSQPFCDGSHNSV